MLDERKGPSAGLCSARPPCAVEFEPDQLPGTPPPSQLVEDELACTTTKDAHGTGRRRIRQLFARGQ